MCQVVRPQMSLSQCVLISRTIVQRTIDIQQIQVSNALALQCGLGYNPNIEARQRRRLITRNTKASTGDLIIATSSSHLTIHTNNRNLTQSTPSSPHPHTVHRHGHTRITILPPSTPNPSLSRRRPPARPRNHNITLPRPQIRAPAYSIARAMATSDDR